MPVRRTITSCGAELERTFARPTLLSSLEFETQAAAMSDEAERLRSELEAHDNEIDKLLKSIA